VNYFWLDASALVKRYVREIGTPLINHFYQRVSASAMVCLLESIGEVTSVLVRGRNSKLISAPMFRQIMSQFEIEVSKHVDFEKFHLWIHKWSRLGNSSSGIQSTVPMRLFSGALSIKSPN
jgi:hypothetical protein